MKRKLSLLLIISAISINGFAITCLEAFNIAVYNASTTYIVEYLSCNGDGLFIGSCWFEANQRYDNTIVKAMDTFCKCVEGGC